jgi:hypothetical protein
MSCIPRERLASVLNAMGNVQTQTIYVANVGPESIPLAFTLSWENHVGRTKSIFWRSSHLS